MCVCCVFRDMFSFFVTSAAGVCGESCGDRGSHAPVRTPVQGAAEGDGDRDPRRAGPRRAGTVTVDGIVSHMGWIVDADFIV